MPQKSLRNEILRFYQKEKYGKDIYSTYNPVSIYEIFLRVLKIEITDTHEKFMKTTFIRAKDEELKKEKNDPGYTFHSLTTWEINKFIKEVDTIVANKHKK